MKFIKNMLIGFLNILLINLIFVFVISLNLKSIITDGIIKETIKQQITTNEYQEEANKIVTDNEQINKILESKEVQDLIDKYLDVTINGVLDEKDISNIEIEKDMLDFLKENKEVLEKEVGIEITDEMISKTEEQLESRDLSKVFEQTINNTKNNLPEEAKVVLKGYNFLISLKFRIIILIAMIIDLLLIALIQKSFYSWLKSLGVSAIISGSSLLIMSLSVNVIVTKISSLTDFNVNSLITSGIVLIVSGIVITVIKKIIDKQITKNNQVIEKEDVNEISTVSE
ncbi:MAG: hypothetical protein HFE81_05725 [Bacilli bacterium]|nr:hypothetical protein [Bacilli bacterium]